MMGAGKSTVGRLLADRLGWCYLDSDEQVERATGQSVVEIFASQGEAAFRAEERAALAAALSSDEPTVVSVAGGAVLDPESQERIRRAPFVVWLRASPATLAGRVGDGHGRPMLGAHPAAALVDLDAARRPIYEQLATMAIDVDHLVPSEVVNRVVAGLR